jgi:PAS domain S-box-containing protein
VASSDPPRRKRAPSGVKPSAALSAEQLAAVLRAAGDAIVVQGADESIVFANGAAARLIGHADADALAGLRLEQMLEGFEAFDEEGAALGLESWPAKRVMQGEPEACATVCMRSRLTGDEHWASITSTPMRDATGAIEFVVTAVRDVTAEKRVLTELRDAQSSLASKAEELATAVQIRDEFLSIASHELKTPLTSLQLNLDLLVRAVHNREPIADDRAIALMDAAQRQHRRLARLVNELLDVSRIASGRLRLEPERFDLVALTIEVCSRFRSEIDALGATLHVHGSRELHGDWDRLRMEQVLTHLVSNAVRYGRRRPIDVLVDKQRSRARVEVRDEGIGIAPEAAERIFGRFERAASARNYGGLGLGLYIVRQIVEAHGGTIAVASRPGEGSTFTVEIPLDSRPFITSG